MDFLISLKVSASGLTAQRTRMDIIASNLANINTTRTAEGGPYRKKSPVFTAVISGNLSDASRLQVADNLREVRVTDIVEDKREPKMVFDPSHPDANTDGYVAMPNVNLMEEMVDMISATRAYEANITAISNSKSMAQRALDIGGR
ncbi:MAG: flagellar basal body rod protein FlgC [Nitrospinae bacterium]|nr:flagellar basal body rod protein FlgC [Nitrospinota bacterium]